MPKTPPAPTPKRFIDMYVVRYVRHKPQLMWSIAAAIVTGLACALLTPLALLPGLLVAWNAFVLTYIVLGFNAMRTADRQAIKDHAHLYDDGEGVILLLSVLGAILTLVAIVFVLAKPDSNTAVDSFHTLLAVVTLALSWTFIHTAFAFHYAHGFYFPPDHEQHPPLLFPSCAEPVYADFLYFSFILGTSAQTADVSIASTPMRRIALIHCVVAYVFNAAVLGLTINIAASLISK